MYYLIIFPLLSGLIAQTIKMFIRGNHIKLSAKNLVAYSGMPSGHSATVVSLCTIVALTEGFDSATFAIAMVFSILIIRDALGIRRYLGEHGKVLNRLVKDLNDDDFLDEHYPHILEQIGHTPAQVLAGSVLGLLVSLFGYLIVI